MHKKVYFDTNVIVDIFDEGRPFHDDSLLVMKTIFENEEIEVFINTDTLTNLFYILRSHIKLSFDDALQKMTYIKESFTIVSIELAEIEQTLEICQRHIFKDYEDAMQYMCAMKAECSLIISNNPKDFKNAGIEIVTSPELAQIFKTGS